MSQQRPKSSNHTSKSTKVWTDNSNSNDNNSSAPNDRKTTTHKKRGWDEIESLFDEKKNNERRNDIIPIKEKVVSRIGHRNQQRSSSFKSLTNEKRNHSDTTNTARIEDWVDDGLGGKYNSEGFTGRVSDDGMKIYKAHVLAKNRNAGQTKDCPFDCTCCYI
jgi:Eukaryotic protein of unknown function (DUF1764)